MTDQKPLPPVPHEAGKSSFDLVDFDLLLSSIVKKEVAVLVDMGAGEGRYSLPLAKRLGAGVQVVAVDLWNEGLQKLEKAAGDAGLGNVMTIAADLGEIPLLCDGLADMVLMSTVLHDLKERRTEKAALREVARILRKGGELFVVEFRKVDSKPGPPLKIRLAPEEVAHLLRRRGFSQKSNTDIGENLYLSVFIRD